MGHLRAKYTKQYLLRKDENGNPLKYGIIGAEDFLKGDIREFDKKILNQVDFKNQRVLEFGFGRGEAMKFASNQGASYIAGVDFADQSKKIASGMLKKNNIKADLFCDDALNFIKNFQPDSKKFDIVLMLDFIEHVPRKELTEILSLLKNILSERAILAVNTPVFRVDNDVIEEGLKSESFDESDEYEETSGMHCNKYTRLSLFLFMNNCGFGAITGHLFGNNYKSDYKIVDSEFFWRKARKNGYFIKEIYNDTVYEYAFSNKDLTFIQEGIDNKKLLNTGDYDFKNIKLVHFDDFSMFMTPRFIEFYAPYKFEKFSSDLIYNFTKKDDVFVDIGGHYGYYSLLLSKKIGINGKIHTFEPVAENNYILSKNILYNKLNNVKIYQAAISDKNGEKKFQITEASDSAGFYGHPLTKTIDTREIKTYALDDLFSNNKIDIVKIDTEGHEMSVLDGMKRIIEKNSQIKLFIEFNPKCLLNAGEKPEELLEKISNLGFDIYFIKDKERELFKLGSDISIWKDIMDELEYVNIFCLKKENSLFVSFISHSANKAGAERSLLDTIDEIIEGGALAHIILPNHGPLEQEILKRPVSYSVIDFPWWANIKESEKQNIQRSIMVSALEIALKLRFINPDVIYTSTSVINAGAIAARLMGIPHIWNISEFGKEEHGIKYMLNEKERMKFISKHADKIFFVSNALKKYYFGKVDDSKMVVMPNQIRINSRNEKSKKYFNIKNALRAVVLGNIIQGKGQKDAILATVKLISNGKNIELILAGSLDSKVYYDKLQKIIDHAKLQKNIRFIGYIDDSVSLIEQSDIILVCSIDEGFGRVTAEGMLLKKPIIGANSGATPELIMGGVTGFLYTPGNYNELSEKIKYFIEHKDDMIKFGENGYNFINKTFMGEERLKKIMLNFMELKNKNRKKSTKTDFFDKFMDIFWKTKNEIKELKNIIQQKEQEIKTKNQKIMLMKSSKFWKLRNQYIKLKNKLKIE